MKKTNRSQVHQAGKRAKVFKSEANLGSARLRAIPFALALVFGSASSFADPMSGVVAEGAAAISAANGITTVNQMSDRAVVNWQSFNVNAGETVEFVQPSSTAAILNRVTGGSVSNIDGLVVGNGRVYLVNPNGIVVGANGVINVNGGFVASTRDVSTDAFINGGALVFTGESTGSIQVLGKVQSAQGDVILIAPKIAIEKTGTLVAGQEIKLVAANEVELSNGKLTVKPKASDAGQITIEGALEAAKVQLAANNNNLGALAINTSGNIRATGTQINPDGSVSIIATGEGGSINISGNIRSEQGDGNGGAVTVLADNTIKVSGTINANSSDISKVGGDIYIGRDITTNKLARATDASGAILLSNKGFVETSGDYLKTDGITVLAKDWLLDPFDIVIGSGSLSSPVPNYSNYTPTSTTSTILATDIAANLTNGTNVKISTGLAGSSGGQAGDITVNANIVKTGTNAATLTLEANNRITINSGFKITDSTTYNQDGTISANGGLGVHLIANGDKKNGASIVIGKNSAIDVGGKVEIDATSSSAGLSGAAIYMALGSLNKAETNIGGTRTVIRGSEVDIDMKLSGNNTWGLFTQNATGIEATTGDINIKATYSGASTSGRAVFMGSGWNGSYAPASGYLKAANGFVSVESKTAGTQADGTLSFSSVAISALKNITLKTESGNAASTAINVTSEFGNAPSIKAGDDVLIGSTQGSIQLGSLGLDSITGKNIVIDNTGGSLNTTSGLYEKGSGSFTATSGANIRLTGVANAIKATEKIDIVGVGTQSGSTGVWLDGAGLNAGKDITVRGENVGLSGTNGVISYSTITSTGGSVHISGKSDTGSALSLQGPITAQNNVKIEGNNKGADNNATALLINKAVEAKTGTIDLIASTAGTAGTTTYALQLNSGSVLKTTNQAINMTTDSLSVTTVTATPTVINAGNGTVTIKTASADAKIDIGSGTGIGASASGVDAGSTTTGERILGLSKDELGRITAGNTVIGDISTHTGGITVSGAVSAAAVATTGNITLETGGNIDVKATLSAANNRNLTLKAIGDINVNNTISQGGAGNIVLAAGYGKGAGDGLGGQVKRAGAGTVSNNSGNTYIYTGSVADSAKMSDLNNNAFGTLTLSGSGANAQSFADSNGTNTISGSTAKMQVMYREKIAVDLTGNNALNNATKTYGDVANDSDAVNAIKGANNPSKTLVWTTLNGNAFNLSSDALIGTLSVDNLSSKLSTAGKLKASPTAYGTTSSTYSVKSPQALPTLKVNQLTVSLSNLSTVLNYNGALLSQSLPVINKPINNDVLGISSLSLAKGTAVGTYVSALALDGADSDNYAIGLENGTLVINYSGANKAPTPTETYTRIAGDVVNLAPVSFAVGVAPATAAGDEADPNICYAWGQRDSGSVTVHTVLKPSYLGLRHAKTDTQEAMSNSGGSSSHEASPCGKDFATNFAEANIL